nr:glycosyltransferase [uncultured Sphaerochaeta sp.]
MKTVLFYISNLKKGGAQRVLSTLSNHFAETYQIILLTTTYGKSSYELHPSIQLLSLDDSSEAVLENKFKKNIRRNKRLLEIVDTYHPAVIITFLEREIFRILYIRKKITVPVIVSFRNDPQVDYASLLPRLSIKWLIKRADGIVFQTPDAKQFFSGCYRCNDTIIPNPLNPVFLIERDVQQREPRIVTVGKLFPQKNHALLIRSFATIAEEFPNYTLEIFGEGDLREPLQTLIHELALDSRVFLRGIMNNIEEYLFDASMFVLSSDYEGVSNALIEAMALGLPVISTDCPCGGSAMLIDDGVNGLLTPVGDEQALASAMRKMILDKSFSQRLGNRAKEVREIVHPQAVFSLWDLYIDAVSNRANLGGLR